ncbi:hypothetical protein TNIN_450701 [Trichonephila inaurata madagascariensis]|uniref:Uncharacterized protein n=1 Tax=Trichonephila inaurata madagascariensis TaxID=2747483 RepID=A0A8X7C1Z4_9ARAC|nr:hypothetical protein TNIN_450701 [Trichonephila inaurata madagascariensis]
MPRSKVHKQFKQQGEFDRGRIIGTPRRISMDSLIDGLHSLFIAVMLLKHVIHRDGYNNVHSSINQALRGPDKPDRGRIDVLDILRVVGFTLLIRLM